MSFISGLKSFCSDFGTGFKNGLKLTAKGISKAVDWVKDGGLNDTVNKATTWIGNQFNNATGATAKMEWEKMMSDTAHQREVADMKAAGLNPVLSAGGSGASTPSAPSGSGDIIGSILGLVGTASKVMNSSANLIKANTDRQLAISGYKSFRKYK